MSAPEVEIKQGKLRGGHFKTTNGIDCYKFLGIPYAQPPVGDLRFRAPVPAAGWEGVRDSTKNGHKCPQIDPMNTISSEIVGSEDCLFVNVYTTTLETNAKPLPVMFFIHGGGFFNGSGDEDFGRPEFLLEQNVVYVSLNYRLSIFGFLNLDLPEAQGNMGLKDQVLALKWVQDNIAAFNGDPSNVTIYGMSAGGASVEILYLSPMADGLFHRAIAQSGSALNHWAHNDSIKDLAFSITKSQGQEFKSTRKLLEYLKKIPADELTSLTNTLREAQEKKKGSVFLGFVPSIETEFPGQTSFKTKRALEVLKSGSFKKVPYISGFCRHEGLLAYLPPFNGIKTIKDDKDFIGRLPYILHKTDLKTLEDRIQKTYPNKTGDKEDTYVDFFTDVDFLGGSYVASKLIAQHSDKPVYFYEFAHEGDSNFVKAFLKIDKPGVIHCAEASYIYKLPGGMSDFTERDAVIRSRLLSMWTNFAKFGNPTPQVTDLIPTKWQPVPKEGFKYLIIDDELTIGTDLAPERMAFHEEFILKS